MFRTFLGILVTTILLTACSSGHSALKRGHFDLAVQKASHRLTQRPGLSKRGHGKAPFVLKQAFVSAYEQHQTAIRRLSSPSNQDPFRWETVYANYTAIQTLTDHALRGFAQRGFAQRGFAQRGFAQRGFAQRGFAQRGVGNKYLDCVEWLAAYPVSYADQQRETRELAATDRYEAAEQAFVHREEDRLAAKAAFLNYRKATDWMPDFRQARAKAADALPFAMLRVVVEPLSPTPEISPGDNQELQNMVFEQLGRSPAPSDFVRLYTPDALTSGDVPDYTIHQVVQMQVTNYSPYDEQTASSSTTIYSNKEYKVGEKKINDSTTVDVMEKVKGTLTTHRRVVEAGLSLRMRAIDTQTGTSLWEQPIRASQSWATEWETFSGDDRALNGHNLKSADLFSPSRGSLYNRLRNELASDILWQLRNRYATD